MTVSSTTNRKEYLGDGSTVAFSTSPVVFFDNGDLSVYLVVTATGVATLQTLTTHYTVSGGSGSTGVVTMITAPTSAQTLVIVRNMTPTQAVDFVNNEATDAEVAEDALDKLTMIAQQLSVRLDRAVSLADGDVTGADLEMATPAASKLIGWDSTGLALTSYPAASIADTIIPTAFVETLLDDESAAVARATLDVPSNAEAVLATLGTAAGDTAEWTASGVVARKPATATVAAHATTCDIWNSRETILSGSAVTFTDIVDADYVGQVAWVKMNAAHIWTHGAVFTVQGGATYTTAANYWLRIEAITVSTFSVTIFPVSGAGILAGSIVQSVYGEYLTWGSTATVIPADDTIPQITEGAEIINVVITPKSTANKVRVRFVVNCSSNAVANVNAALFKDAVANALRAWTAVITSADWGFQIIGEYEDSPATVSTVTYRLRIGPNANIMYLNGTSSSRQFGGVAGCTLVVEEIKG